MNKMQKKTMLLMAVMLAVILSFGLAACDPDVDKAADTTAAQETTDTIDTTDTADTSLIVPDESSDATESVTDESTTADTKPNDTESSTAHADTTTQSREIELPRISF